jgi:hypothetical protein
MEERPYFSPSAQEGSENRGEEKKATFSLATGGKNPKRKFKLPISFRKILLLLLGVVFLIVILNTFVCSGTNEESSNQAANTPVEDAGKASQESTEEDTDQEDSGGSEDKGASEDKDLISGESTRKDYSGDTAISVAGEEVTADEVKEREGLISDYLKVNDINDFSEKETKDAAVYQLIQVAWSRAAAAEAGINISAALVRSEAKKGGGSLTKNLLKAGYSEAQVEDLIRLELIQRQLKKEAKKKARNVKMSRVRKAYKNSGSKKPFRKVKGKFKKKVRAKQIKTAEKKFEAQYSKKWKSETACSPDYKVDACGSVL